MNILSLMAFLLAGAVLGFGIQMSGGIKEFMDPHAALIVVGGTIAAGSISFQVDRIFMMFKVFFKRVLKQQKMNYPVLISELMGLSEAYRTNSPKLDDLIKKIQDPFLRESMQALMDEALEPQSLVRVLRSRIKTMFQRQSDEVLKFKTLGKYPPAFGLMGTTLSMITLLKRLAEPGAQKILGPAMALGLIATFYGLVLANMIFNPIAENLADSSREAKIKNTIIVEGIRLILLKTNPVVLAEELNSFLLPSERIDWKKAAAGNVGKKAA